MGLKHFLSFNEERSRHDSSKYAQEITFLGFSYFSILILSLFAVTNLFVLDNIFLFVVDSSVVFFQVFLLLWVKKRKNFFFASFVLVVVLAIVTVLVMLAFNQANQTFIWVLLIPALSILLLGERIGLLVSLVHLITFIVLGLLFIEDSVSVLRVFSLYILTLILLYYFERSREETFKKLHDVNVELQEYKNTLEIKVKQAVSEQEQEHNLLIQQSKMASIGELLESIAHQWKQPISAISAIALNLRVQEEIKGGGCNQETIKKSDAINEQTEFMTLTMNEFRSFFKAQGEQQSFSIQNTSQKLFKLFSPLFKSMNIHIIENHQSSDFYVQSYENMYKQVLLNIINNAKDIIISNEAKNRNIELNYKKDDAFAYVEIQDYAGGIPSTIIDKIFHKHFSTKGDQGSGIGLWMSKDMIENSCQGKIWVENKNGGACFTIKLPLMT